MAAVPNGVFWRGQDGNVWVKGANGTNSAGAWDDNTTKYWSDRGFGLLNYDPGFVGSQDWGPEQEQRWDSMFNKYSGDTTTPQQNAANSQISQINSLLGVLNSQEASGLSNIQKGYDENKRRLTEDQTLANQGYQDQFNQNAKYKQRGLEQVGDFANNTYNSLQRLLQGAGAGVSSVAKYVVPGLVSKGASERRTNVFDTTGENQRSIDNAKRDSEIQFARSFSDLDTQKQGNEQNFRASIGQQRADLLAKLLGLQQDAGYATAGTQTELDQKLAQLNSLFGGYNPSYNTKAVNLRNPELAQYQVDPAKIGLSQDQASSYNYYNPLLRKKQQQV